MAILYYYMAILGVALSQKCWVNIIFNVHLYHQIKCDPKTGAFEIVYSPIYGVYLKMPLTLSTEAIQR